MSISVEFECGGCFKTAEAKRPQRRFESFSGRGYGLGTHYTDDFQDIAPEGWVAFDPYTGCTYCPECWESIESGVTDKEQRA